MVVGLLCVAGSVERRSNMLVNGGSVKSEAAESVGGRNFLLAVLASGLPPRLRSVGTVIVGKRVPFWGTRRKTSLGGDCSCNFKIVGARYLCGFAGYARGEHMYLKRTSKGREEGRSRKKVEAERWV